jgi:glycyl-tRNA synthetase beta chain
MRSRGRVERAHDLGHRFHSSRGCHHLLARCLCRGKLERAIVIVDQERRKQIIESRAKALRQRRGMNWSRMRASSIENAGLTEWPVPLLGRFDPAFLEVPPEVIQLTLRINQKYFVLRDKAGKLANAFVCTANIEAKDKGGPSLRATARCSPRGLSMRVSSGSRTRRHR